MNPLSERADVTAGAIAVRLDDLERARAAFARAVERNERNWYALLELGPSRRSPAPRHPPAHISRKRQI